MAKDPKKRHQKDLKRRLKQRQVQERERQRGQERTKASQERLAQELGTPERLAVHLQHFAKLALVAPGLHGVRYPAAPFLDALLSVELIEEGKSPQELQAEIRQAVIPKVAQPELIPHVIHLLSEAISQAERDDELLALMGARAFAHSCGQNPEKLDHPFWAMLYDLSISEAVLSGHFLIRFVLSRSRPDVARVGEVFAKALAQAELARELDELGLEEHDPTQLAQEYAQLVEQEDLYNVQFDAVLRLATLHVGLAESAGPLLTSVGPTPRLKDEIWTLYQQTFLDDFTPGLVEELTGWFKSRLELLKASESQKGLVPDGASPEDIERERRRGLVALLATRTLPREDCELLRVIHARSLVLSRLTTSELELPFIEKLWSRPGDVFALEEYEGFLRQQGHAVRGKRVRRHLDDLRAARKAYVESLKEAAAEQAAPQQETDSAPAVETPSETPSEAAAEGETTSLGAFLAASRERASSEESAEDEEPSA